MADTETIAFFLFNGFEALDVSGPASVFNAANTLSGKRLYDLVYVSACGGTVVSNSAMPVETSAADHWMPDHPGILVVPGSDQPWLGEGLRDEAVIAAVARLAQQARRICSVCTGSFLLAEADCLSGRRATTHWAAREQLAARRADILVDQDSLYVIDGDFWTSAGASAGIDMVLEMLRHDHGADLMREVARWLVLYSHRPGRQSQFSSMLAAQSAGGGFSDLIAWMQQAMPESLTVVDMAARAGMSERTFYRRFTEAVGETPARFLDRMRMERAKDLLEEGQQVKRVAHLAGYRTESGFRAAFESTYGLSPSLHRMLHGSAGHGDFPLAVWPRR